MNGFLFYVLTTFVFLEKEKMNGESEALAAGGSDGEKKGEEGEKAGDKEKRFMMPRRKFEFTKELRYCYPCAKYCICNMM